MPSNPSISKGGQAALIGAGLAAAAGTAAFLLVRRTGSGGVPLEEISDAPDHVWRRGTSHYDPDLLGKTLTIVLLVALVVCTVQLLVLRRRVVRRRRRAGEPEAT